MKFVFFQDPFKKSWLFEILWQKSHFMIKFAGFFFVIFYNVWGDIAILTKFTFFFLEPMAKHGDHLSQYFFMSEFSELNILNFWKIQNSVTQNLWKSTKSLITFCLKIFFVWVFLKQVFEMYRVSSFFICWTHCILIYIV